MNTSYKAYFIASVVFTITFLGIAFDKMQANGWLSQEEVGVLSFVLSIWVVLTLALIAKDLVQLLFKQSRPHPRGAILIGVGVVVGFALLTGHDAPAGYYAEAVRIGALVGVIPALEFVIYAEPVANRLRRVQERLEERGVVG
jgi:hypothetical protein